MIKLNCDSANKMVKQLQTDRDALLAREREVRTYSYLADEKPELPEYDFGKVQAELAAYADKIVKLKHAINKFNVSTTLQGLDMTIDAALVRMAILSNEKRKLETMRNMQPKTRMSVARGVSEYTIRNYSAEDVQAQYEKVCEELVAIQQAINIANLTETFEVDIGAAASGTSGRYRPKFHS